VWKTELAVLIGLSLSTALLYAQARTEKQPFNSPDYYRSNCAECHGKTAEKRFEPSLPEQQMVDAILYGEQLETPPDMPAFADKGINQERAKALIALMKSLKE